MRAANSPKAIRPDRRVMQSMCAGGQKARHCRTAEQPVSSHEPVILQRTLESGSSGDEGPCAGRRGDTGLMTEMTAALAFLVKMK